MSVPTRTQPPGVPVFSERDLRDPAILGELLLRSARDSLRPLSGVYDRDAWLLDRLPAWVGDGRMSNDPARHHSRTPQTHLTQTPAPEVTSE